MFKKLFKPKWQHRDPVVRKIAVDRLDAQDQDDQQVIQQLAQNDPSQEVRRAAVNKLLAIAVLLQLLEKSSDASEQGVMKQRLAELISDDNNAIPLKEKQEALQQLNDPDLYRYVLQNSSQPDLLLIAVTTIEDQEQLEQLAIKGKVAKVRKCAAERLTQADALSRVMNASKGKDKNVYRISKDKLDTLREQQQKEKQEQAECERLCQQIESLSRTPVEPLYEQKLKHLIKQWQELDSQHKPSFEQRFQSARETAEKALSAYQEAQAKRIEEGERTQSAEQELQETVRVIEEAIQLVQDTAHAKDVDLPAIQGLVTTQENRWQEAASVVTPEGALKGKYQKVSKDLRDFLKAARVFVDRMDELATTIDKAQKADRKDMATLQQLRKRLQKTIKQVNWPTLFRMPEELQKANSQVDQIEKWEAQLLEQSKQTQHNIEEAMAKFEQEVDSGRVKVGNRKLKDLQNLLKRLPHKETEQYQHRMKRLTSQLNELKDWQGFVTTPKKEQLCEQMEALIDADLDPQERADQVKLLQDEWKQLGRAEPGREQELWQRFREAGDKAFEPCKAYFDELAQQRQRNVEKRNELCDQLQLYIDKTDWDNVADWTNVLEVLKVAKREWRDYSPVERKANKTVQTRFDNLLNDLQGKLDAERDRNAERRQALIDQVKGLLAEEDIEFAVGETKRLQQEWKQVGLVQRKVDNQLWKSFREACDQIFERRQQKWDDERAAREGNQEKADTVCSNMEAFLNQPGEQLLEQKAKARDFKQQFDDCYPLPKKTADELRGRFHSLQKQIDQKIAQARREKERQAYEQLWEKAEICQQLEQAIINGELTDDSLNQFKDRWAQSGDMPDAAELPMNTRFDVAVEAYGAGDRDKLREELARNNDKLNELVIRMEIAAGVESPESDRQKRMELQVNRLSESLGGAGPDRDEQYQLLVQWCATGPVDAEVYQRYLERFKRAYYGEEAAAEVS